MKKNLGSADRAIRLVLAVLFVVLYFAGITSGTLGIVLIVLGAVFALTSFVSFCPIYYALGISSNGKKEDAAGKA